MIQGNIPTKLTVCAKGRSTVSVKWDDGDDELVSFEARPAFFTDSSRPKTVETARAWAKRTWGRDKVDVVEFEVDNTPEVNKELKINGLERRDQGGRAYKVVIPYKGENYYVDLREDTLLDVILNSTIEKGKPNCDFIWARVGSQMKLVRVGSKIHGNLVEATKFDNKPLIKKGDLEIGGIYSSKTDHGMLFLGYGQTYKMNVAYRYGYGQGYNHYIKKFDKSGKCQIWISFDHKAVSSVKDIKKAITSRDSFYYLNIVKSRSVKNMVGKIDGIDPKEIFHTIRNKAQQCYMVDKYVATSLHSVAGYCESIHLVTDDEPLMIHDFYKQYPITP